MSKKIAIALLILFTLGSFFSHVTRAPKKGYADFRCFYTAGKRFLAKEDIYVLRDKEAAEFRYTPFFAMLMSALALLDERQADTLWYLINFSLLAAALIFLKKLVVPDRSLNRNELLTLYALTIFGSIRFIFHNLDTGQSNLLMLSSMAIGLYHISKKREALGGAIFALSCMIKYTPLIFIPYFILRKKMKLSAAIIVFLGIYLFLPALFVGFKTNLLYLKNLMPFLTSSTIFDQMTILDPKNQSLFSFIHRIFTNCVLYFYAPAMPFSSLNLSAKSINLIFASSAIILYTVSLLKRRNDIINYALLSICVALFNLNAWLHNFIFLMPAYFIIAYYLIKNKFKDKAAACLIGFAYFLNFITIKAFVGKTLSYKLYFYSPFTLGALVTFLVLLKIGKYKIEEEPRG